MSGRKKQTELLVGLTGGIGSGKSMVAESLRKRGIPVIDADELAREVVAKGSPAVAEIEKAFGSEAVAEDGTLNRGYLRQLIFANPERRKELEAITHPKIRKLSRARTDELFRNGHKLVVYEAPLLIEAGNYQHLDAIIGVQAKDEVRIERISKRDGVSREDAAKAIAAQMPQEQKMQYCDYVIQNDSTPADLEAWVEAILRQLQTDTKTSP